ncbi:MAG: class I poly(R)-hydroxyalkanoic acid synthase [Gammaproteobacteria bacterium]|nr:class I poly(R)-hydroxyalkanoic acid synthase [Gammaproteobacteria bacterium]
MAENESQAPFDPVDLAKAVMQVAQQTQHTLLEFANQRHAAPVNPDPLGVLPVFQTFLMKLMGDPAAIFEAQMNAWTEYLRIWQQTARHFAGADAPDALATPKGDRRFRDPQWTENPFFDYLKQVYLLVAETVMQLVSRGKAGLDPKTAHKLEFYSRQIVDALAPNNFLMTNPEVIRKTLETGGSNLVHGLQNFLRDIDPKNGSLHVKMVDTAAFELGRNIATTRGAVVFQNDLMQLIQFEPATREVYRRPLLITPPWINKFYILDLQPRNSFIKWAVDRGYTVFVVSWVNPGAELAEKDFENYVFEGPLAALDAIEKATGERDINCIGYCIGGTLLGTALAYLRATGDTRVQSATFFTSLLDFSDVGDIGVFVDEEQVSHLEDEMNERGFLDGSEMASAFNMIRANDLIWSFVINNYLLGKDPAAFDLLFWNADSTRMPARMHSTYLRKMYLQNALREPGGLVIGDEPIDLRKIDVPACFVSTVEDHIAPWKTTYLGAQLLSGPVEFLLGKAGHVAGIVNPPGPKQYGHFTGPAPVGLTSEQWLARATAQEGSWWLRWAEFIERFAGDKVPARIPGTGTLPIIEPAPGSYVKVRLN